MTPMTAEAFIRKCAEQRGRIVSSNECGSMEIAYARAAGRFYVDTDGLGYVLRPGKWRNPRTEEVLYFRKGIACVLSLFIALMLCGFANADVADGFEAVCRITTTPNAKGEFGTGTGTAFKVSDKEVHILTNAHVATTKDVRVEFWRGGYVSKRFPGKVSFRTNLGEEGGVVRPDVAIVTVQRSALPSLPKIIPLADGRASPDKGQAVYSIGCALGQWPSMFRGHVINKYDGYVEFVPCPAEGRSGSALLNKDGTRIIGLVAWQNLLDEHGRALREPYGTAMSIALVRSALAGEKLPPAKKTSQPLPTGATGRLVAVEDWQPADPGFVNQLRDAGDPRRCPPGSPFCPLLPRILPGPLQQRPQQDPPPSSDLDQFNPWLSGDSDDNNDVAPEFKPVVPVLPTLPLQPVQPDRTPELQAEIDRLKEKLKDCKPLPSPQAPPVITVPVPEQRPTPIANKPSDFNVGELLAALPLVVKLLLGAGIFASGGGGIAGAWLLLKPLVMKFAAKKGAEVVSNVVTRRKRRRDRDRNLPPGPAPEVINVSPAPPQPAQRTVNQNHYVTIDSAATDRAWAHAHRLVAEKYPGAKTHLQLSERVKNQILAGEASPEF